MYLDGATAMLNGQPLTVRQPSYAGYIAYVAAFEAVGLGTTGVVLGQVIAAAGAAALVCRLASTIGGVAAGVVAGVLLIVDYETNRWHAYVLSDSLLASALMLVTWLVYRAAEARRIWKYALALGAMVGAATIRPEGWFLIPVAAVYWIVDAPIDAPRRMALLIALLAVGIALALAVVPRLGGNMEAVGPGEMLRRGQTIWEYDGWRLTMPSGPDRSPGTASAADAVSYAIAHPVSAIKLMGARVAVHFAHVRPFFSPKHNLLIAAWLIPVYLCAARGVFVTRGQSLAWVCLLVIGSQTLVVALTHADWDGRYLAHLSALIYTFAAVGAMDWLRRWREPAADGPAVA